MQQGKSWTWGERINSFNLFLPLSPKIPSMLCLAFLSLSSSFFSQSSSSSFFPNLIRSTRLIELTNPQTVKDRRRKYKLVWKKGRGRGNTELSQRQDNFYTVFCTLLQTYKCSSLLSYTELFVMFDLRNNSVQAQKAHLIYIYIYLTKYFSYRI